MVSVNGSDPTRCTPNLSIDTHLSKGAAVGYIIIGGIGFTSNVFIDYIIYRLRLYRVLGHCLILSLSISDMIQSLLVCTFNSVELLTESGFPVSQSWCRLSAGLGLLAVLSTCLNLVGISMDRFVAIFFPLHYPQIVTPSRVYVYLAITWISMVTWSFLPLIGWNSSLDCLRNGYTICDWGFSLDFNYFTGTSVVVLTAVIIVIILQATIYVQAIKQARKVYGKESGRAEAGRSELSRVQKKVSRVVAFIVLTFFITYIPWFSLAIRTVVTQSGGHEVILACCALLYTNSMLNPWVYASSDSNIRKEVLSVLHLRGGRNNQVNPTLSTSNEKSDQKQPSNGSMEAQA